MRFRSISSLVVVFGLVTVATPRTSAQQPAQTPEARLGAALHHAEVTGDLEKAIAAYRDVIADRSATRATVASALVGLGTVYEKLGRPEARAQYERVAAEFGDQPAAAAARLRLGPRSDQAGPSLLWAEAKVDALGNGRVSPDGRHLAYVDWASGNLAVRDLSAGTDRRLTDGADLSSPEIQIYAGRSTFSPDGTSIAYAWFNGDRYEIRLASLAERGIPTATVVLHNEEVEWVRPDDWSPDGRWLALQLRRLDRTGQVALLDLRDHTVTVLKSFPWDAPSRGIRFSPDGRHLAFDLRSAQTSTARDIYLLAVDGSRETPAVVHPREDEMFEWSPDGRGLLFWSDRSGSVDLWTMDVADGKPSGTPRLIRARVGEAGRFVPLGLDRTGALFYVAHRATDSGIRIADIDFDAARLTSAPRDAGLELGAVNQTTSYAWSANGDTLAVLRRVQPGMESPFVLTTKDMTSGAVGESRPSLGSCWQLQWSSDGTFFLCSGADLRERQGILRIEVRGGSVTYLTEGRAPALSRDSRALYLLRPSAAPADAPHLLIERSISDGTERELLRSDALVGLRLSPDGRWLATVATDKSQAASRLLVVPAGTGPSRTLVTETQGERIDASTLFWAPDSGSVFVGRSTGRSTSVLVRAGLDGTITTHDDLMLGTNVQVHPSGQQIAYFTGVGNVTDVFRLDGLLAAQPRR